MKVLNCWEYFKCGREVGGENTRELGICPASTSIASNGINGGKNAGRYCWSISGTLCNKTIQGGLEEKLQNCINCKFFKKVNQEEGREFILLADEFSEIIK